MRKCAVFYYGEQSRLPPTADERRRMRTEHEISASENKTNLLKRRANPS